MGRKKKEGGQSKVLQRTRSRRRFMDSARSHLKDYIEQTITNRPFFSRGDWFNSLLYPLWYRFSRHPRSLSRLSAEGRGRESSNCSLMTMRRQVAAVQLYFMGISWCWYWLRFLILKCRWKRGQSREERSHFYHLVISRIPRFDIRFSFHG